MGFNLCYRLQIFYIRNKISYNNGRILVPGTDIDDEKFILINLHERNFEVKQLKTLSEPSGMLTKIKLTQNSHFVFSGDLNLFLNDNLESHGGNPFF